jgi:hypothetical protein
MMSSGGRFISRHYGRQSKVGGPEQADPVMASNKASEGGGRVLIDEMLESRPSGR